MTSGKTIFDSALESGEPSKREGVSPEPTSRVDLFNALDEALKGGDSDGNRVLSRSEFDNFRKAKGSDSDAKVTAFVDKHFGALSVLSKDNLGTDDGISAKDIEQLPSTNPARAKESFVRRYHDVGTGTGGVVGTFAGTMAQVAEIAAGGLMTTTFVSTHAAGAIALPYIVPEAGLSAQAAIVGTGAFWGPVYGNMGGRYVGGMAADAYANWQFSRSYETKLKSLFKDLSYKG